jgi:nucleoside-diphosphate-sugar epimerase
VGNYQIRASRDEDGVQTAPLSAIDGISELIPLPTAGLRFVITGATSDIGSSLTRFLLCRGERVTALVRNPRSLAKYDHRFRTALPSSNVQVVRLFDTDLMSRVIRSHDVLYHLAAARGCDHIPGKHAAAIAVNLLGTLKLIWLAQECNHGIRFVFASGGDSNYLEGKPDVDGWVATVHEFIQENRRNITGESTFKGMIGIGAKMLRLIPIPDKRLPGELCKYFVEQYLLVQRQLTNYVAPRIVFIYGPGIISYGTTSYRLIRARLTGRIASINRVSREFVHINDLTEILWKLGTMRSIDTRFPTVTGGEVLFGDQLWELIQGATSASTGRARLGGDRRLRGRPQSAAWSCQLLGRPFVKFANGLEDQINFTRALIAREASGTARDR